MQYLIHLLHLLHRFAKYYDNVADCQLVHIPAQDGQVHEVVIEGRLGLDALQVVLEGLVRVFLLLRLARFSDHVADSAVGDRVLDNLL